MSNLVIVNTHYQLIVALQIAITKLKVQDTDIIISDHCKGLYEAGLNLKNTNLFRNVYLISNYHTLREASIIQRIKTIFAIGMGNKNIFSLKFLENAKYDEVFYNNFDYQTMSIVDVLLKNNNQTKLNKFEEGIFSYRQSNDIKTNKTVLAIEFLRKISCATNWENNKNKFYCFFDDYAKTVDVGHYKIESISKINKNDKHLKYILDEIYAYKNFSVLDDASVLFFGSAYDCNEVELLDRIAKKCGKKNILVKAHPRKGSEQFEKKGYAILDTTVPWEIIQFNETLKGKKLFTVNSGSILLANALFQEDLQGCFLFPIAKEEKNTVENQYYEYINTNIKNVLEFFHKKNLMTNMRITDEI